MTLWERDWFLSLEGKYQLFVHYLRDHCDHAGVWQPAFKLFERMTGFRVDAQQFLKTVNADSARVVVLENGRWWLTGFIEDQYKTTELKTSVNPHKGVINSIGFNKIPYKSHGYKITLTKGSEGVKDQDQNKDQDQKEGSDKKGKKKARTRFVPPTIQEVADYCRERGNGIDAQAFVDHYQTRGWIPKGYTQQIKDWKAAVRTWEKNNRRNPQNSGPEYEQF